MKILYAVRAGLSGEVKFFENEEKADQYVSENSGHAGEFWYVDDDLNLKVS